MRIQTAQELVANLVYKPEWQFNIRENKRFENTVNVDIVYPAVNSDREDAAAGFPNPIPPMGARASFVLALDSINSDVDLYSALCVFIMQIEEHEMREFLRIEPTFWAPFHPHHTDGIERWAKVTHQKVEYVRQMDMTFGLA